MQWLRTGMAVAAILSSAMCARADSTWVAAGWVSGNWTSAGSPYVISDGWIRVHADSALMIQPGVEVYFAGPQAMLVFGRLTAVGTAQDSIHFVGANVDTLEDAWRGLVFMSTDSTTADSSRLAYAVLKRAGGPGLLYGTGGAIQCLRASPRFDHCLLQNNRALRSRASQIVQSRLGGGVYLSHSDARFTNCEFTRNYPGPLGEGGALFCEDGGSSVFENCVMQNDTAALGGAVAIRNATDPNEYPTFHRCDISQNRAFFDGGGVHLDASHCYFDSCTINSNNSGQCGGGLYTIHDGTANFWKSEMAGNESFWGGAIYCCFSVSGPVLVSSLIHDNVAGYGGAVYSWRAHPVMAASTISRNTDTQDGGAAVYLNESEGILNSTIVSHSVGGAGIFFRRSPLSVLQYCNVGANDGAPYDFYPDESAKPYYYGEIMQTNANGDSCDLWYNLFQDPRFAGGPGEDFHLNWDSPCINAGDPGSTHDPDGSVIDIGAFYRDAAAVDPERTAVRRYELSQNYPNPFNSATRIEFDLPRAGEAELAVYDVTGRLVTTLLSGTLNEGHHNVNWDASHVPSGVYLYRLRTGDGVWAKKMIVLK
jgi:hypothetical protein